MQETTIFREFGPLSGSTMRLSYEVAPKIGSTLSRQTFDGDARKYFRLGGTGLLALRARGFKSWGDSPDFTYFGGNSEMRGYDYLSFIGQNAFFVNAELRFPLIEAMATPIGVLGGVRGDALRRPRRRLLRRPAVQGLHEATRRSRRPIVGYDRPSTDADADLRPPRAGRRLPPGRRPRLLRHQPLRPSRSASRSTSTGRGGRCSTRTGKTSCSTADGGSAAFRKPKFTVWIGYDW